MRLLPNFGFIPYISDQLLPFVGLRSEIIAVIKIHIIVLWVITSCNDVVQQHCFGGP